MKQQTRVILIFILLLLLIVVIIVIVIIIIIILKLIIIIIIIGTRIRGRCARFNLRPQNSPVLVALAAFIVAVFWMRIPTTMHRSIVNPSSIVQKFYQKYRKQFLRLCCCSYHVPPGPGPGGGVTHNKDDQDIFSNTNKSCRINQQNTVNITEGTDTNCKNTVSSINVFQGRSRSGSSRDTDGDGRSRSSSSGRCCSNCRRNSNRGRRNSNRNSSNSSRCGTSRSCSNSSISSRGTGINNCGSKNSSSCCSNTSNRSNSSSNSNSNSNSSNSSNCRKPNRRRRSLSGGLVWLLISLVWLEGPLLISCKMNSNGDHMIKINSSTNRIINTEQQNKKLDILSNNKRFNRIYNKNSNNSNKISSNNNNNSNINNSNNGSTGSGPNNGANNNRSSRKNSYSNKNSNTRNNKNNENTKNSNNAKNNKLKNSLSQNNKSPSNESSTGNRYNRNNKQLYGTSVNSHSQNYNKNNDNDNGSPDKNNKIFDNNYYRNSNNYNYLDQYQIQDQQQPEPEGEFFNEYQQRNRDYHYHTPFHLTNTEYQTQLLQQQQQQQQPQDQFYYHQQKFQPQEYQQYDKIYIDDVDKRSILASIGCPNCVFNKNYNDYNSKSFISSDTSSLGAFLSTSSIHDQHTSALPATISDLPGLGDSKGRLGKHSKHQTSNHMRPTIINNLSSDMIRLESIKRQILSKLGMKNKPNVTHPLPKQFIMDTLYRADGGDYVGVNFGFHSTMSDMSGDYSVNHDTSDRQDSDNSRKGSGKPDDLQNVVMYNTSNSDIAFKVNSKLAHGAAVATDNDHLSSHSYQHQKNYEENFVDTDDFFGSTKEIITFAEKGKMFNGHRLIEFPSPVNQVTSQDLQIRSATIWIRIEVRQQHRRRRFQRQANETHLTIWIFQLSKDDLKDKEFDELATLSSSLNVKPNHLGWQKLDITETVRQWYGRGKSEKLRLLIDCTGCGHRYNLHLFQHDGHVHGGEDDNQQYFSEQSSEQKFQHHYPHHGHRSHHYHHQHNSYNRRSHRKRQRSRKDKLEVGLGKNVANQRRSTPRPSRPEGSRVQQEEVSVDPSRPFLVIHTDPNRVRRVRRRTVDCSGAINGQCCKESFYVSFKALGWDDWIIAPHGYFANYCRGDCGGPHRTPDTFQSYHTHVMEEFRKMDRLNGMQPCCAPLKFSSMSLIYYGNEGIIKRDLPKMVVDECGCP